MNTQQPYPRTHGRRAAAFTLIELLTVIAIIAILAGMTLGIISFAQDKAAEEKTKVGIAMIEAGIEMYRDEYGEYPRPIDNDGRGIAGAIALYQALSGDGDDYLEGGKGIGSTGRSSETQLIDMRSEGFVQEDGRDYFLKDGFDRPYNYQVAEKHNPNATRQKTYDLWSYGKDKEKNDKNDAKWIKNW